MPPVWAWSGAWKKTVRCIKRERERILFMRVFIWVNKAPLEKTMSFFVVLHVMGARRPRGNPWQKLALKKIKKIDGLPEPTRSNRYNQMSFKKWLPNSGRDVWIRGCWVAARRFSYWNGHEYATMHSSWRVFSVGLQGADRVNISHLTQSSFKLYQNEFDRAPKVSQSLAVTYNEEEYKKYSS